MKLNSAQVGESVWMCWSNPSPRCNYKELILGPFFFFWLKTAVTVNTTKWNFCLNFREHEEKKSFSASEGERDEQASEKHTTSQWSNTSKLHRNYSAPYSVIHGRKIICQQARPLNPSKKKSTNLVHYSPSERMNNSQKASWKTDWKSDRTKFVLYLFPLGGVNGITGPIKFWCRGKRRFLCVYVLPQHCSLSIHVCAHVSVCVVKQGQDSISVFGHGAGPVAQGVFWLECGLPVERSRQCLSHTSPERTARSLCQTPSTLYLFLCPLRVSM